LKNNYYRGTFNNYLNQKPLPFKEFYFYRIINQDNPNGITGIKKMKLPWYKWAPLSSLANKIDFLNGK
jgi:hypothetical protein